MADLFQNSYRYKQNIKIFTCDINTNLLEYNLNKNNYINFFNEYGYAKYISSSTRIIKATNSKIHTTLGFYVSQILIYIFLVLQE